MKFQEYARLGIEATQQNGPKSTFNIGLDAYTAWINDPSTSARERDEFDARIRARGLADKVKQAGRTMKDAQGNKLWIMLPGPDGNFNGTGAMMLHRAVAGVAQVLAYRDFLADSRDALNREVLFWTDFAKQLIAAELAASV